MCMGVDFGEGEDPFKDLLSRLPLSNRPRLRKGERNPFLAKLWHRVELLPETERLGMSGEAYFKKLMLERGLSLNDFYIARTYYAVFRTFVIDVNGEPMAHGIPETVFDRISRDDCKTLAALSNDEDAVQCLKGYFAVSKFRDSWLEHVLSKCGQPK